MHTTIYNEVEQQPDGTMGPGSRFYTLNEGTLYKQKSKDGSDQKFYRLAEFDETSNTLIFHQTAYYADNNEVEESQTKFKFGQDMSSLDYSFENYSVTAEKILASESCPGLQRLK